MKKKPSSEAAEGVNPKQAAFLAAYAQVGNISEAAKLAKCHRSQHYVWLSDAEYKSAFRSARREAIDRLEGEARRRAVDGVEEPVYQGGKQVGTVTRYSDTLLIFLLKGAKPRKYRDRHTVEHAGKLNHAHDVDLRGLRTEMLQNPEYLEFVRARALAADQAACDGAQSTTE